MKPGTYLYVVADSNDADYVTALNPITEKQLVKIKPVIEAIKNFKPYKAKTQDGERDWTHSHNYPTGQNLPREDLGEKSPEEMYVKSGLVSADAFGLFDEDFRPFGEYGIHTIKSIELFTVSSPLKLL